VRTGDEEQIILQTSRSASQQLKGTPVLVAVLSGVRVGIGLGVAGAADAPAWMHAAGQRKRSGA